MKAPVLSTTIFLILFAPAAVAQPAQRHTNSPQGAKIYGDATRGQEIVATWCAGCHTMGASVDDRIPSFAALAKNSVRSEGAIRAFLMQPHKPMPPLEISIQQIEDIVAYLRSVHPAPK